jgi:hypothetical protein
MSAKGGEPTRHAPVYELVSDAVSMPLAETITLSAYMQDVLSRVEDDRKHKDWVLGIRWREEDLNRKNPARGCRVAGGVRRH